MTSLQTVLNPLFLNSNAEGRPVRKFELNVVSLCFPAKEGEEAHRIIKVGNVLQEYWVRPWNKQFPCQLNHSTQCYVCLSFEHFQALHHFPGQPIPMPDPPPPFSGEILPHVQPGHPLVHPEDVSLASKDHKLHVLYRTHFTIYYIQPFFHLLDFSFYVGEVFHNQLSLHSVNPCFMV